MLGPKEDLPVSSASRILTIGRDPAGQRGSTTFGESTRIIVSVAAKDPDTLRTRICEVEQYPHDLVEWRVDLSAHNTDWAGALSLTDTLFSHVHTPVLATIRTCEEGGGAHVDDAEYRRLVLAVAEHADIVDIEIRRDPHGVLVEEAHQRGALVLGSFHDMTGTPEITRLRRVVSTQAEAGCDILKFACTARGEQELCRVLETQVWAHTHLARPIIGIAMGHAGSLSRVCGLTLGCAATFAMVSEASAPGQLDASAVRSVLDLLGT